MGIVRPRLKHTNLTTCATQERLFPQDGLQIVHHPFGHAQLTLRYDSNTIYCVCQPKYFYILYIYYETTKNLVYENCRLASAKTIKRKLGKLPRGEQYTQLTAHKPDNVCNASIPSLTGKNLSPQSQRRAHKESINAFYIPQYIVSVKIIYSIFWKHRLYKVNAY